jgi:hypothetical protein
MKKSFKYISVLLLVGLGGCSDIIDLKSESNVTADDYYTNFTELQAGLTSCYKGLQKPLIDEWSLTELRSDNTISDSGSSTSTVNQDFSYLDQFYPSTSHQGNYNYWLSTYNNIRNTNVILDKLGAKYDTTTNTIVLDQTIPLVISVKTGNVDFLSNYKRNVMAAEASFIRAYHYFNLVRLYGGVFLMHEVLTPAEAKTVNRSSVDDIYKLIIADLNSAITNGNKASFTTLVASQQDQIGHANVWAARALLAKVYLTLGRKAEASVLLQSVITSSGYGLESTYANVFSVNNEMNKEILFTIRFKSGGLGMGNSLSNLFTPTNSGMAIMNGDGKGWNTPTTELTSTTFGMSDPSAARKLVNISSFVGKSYINKFMSKAALPNDAENDWPVIRFSDVLLMKAEADGNSVASMTQINLVRTRAGITTLLATTVTPAVFEKALSNERRWEFAFENQRWFDLLRFTTTTATVSLPTDAYPGLKVQGAEYVMKSHFARLYASVYTKFANTLPLTLDQLLENTRKDRFLLPIPQSEIDTNSNIVILQNDSY